MAGTSHSAPRRSQMPEWLKVKLGKREQSERVREMVAQAGLHTVCQSARCPNIGECFGCGTATFLLLGDRCTRNCRFCAVKTGRPQPPDAGEPLRIAQTAARMGLRYAVLTSVTRDDLPDGGAAHFAATIRAVKKQRPGTRVEVLVPDFRGDAACLRTVLEAKPDVLNHNLETVRRLQAAIRPDASYETSLGLLALAAQMAPDIPTKSGLMVGLGETDDEITQAMGDLARVGVALLTIGQYLRPTANHAPVRRYVHPDAFRRYEQVGRECGLKQVFAGPFVRSSYHAERAASSLDV